MSVKLILLDLDGTLLTSEKTISAGSYAALEQCAAKGVHIVPSTGRFYSGIPQAVRETALTQLPEQFPDMAVSSSIPNNIEINAKDANKGQALRFLCRYFGLAPAETIAFGDGSNDLSMIEAAGTGVAMANAEPALLAAADYVTDTNDNDGVAKAIRLFCNID